MTEEEIIQSMRDGGKHLEEGAKVFYKAFYGPMCRFFVNQGASGSEAEDLFQETVIKAINGAGTFSGVPGSGKSWLWAVARNVLSDHMRRQLRGTQVAAADGSTDNREITARSATTHLDGNIKVTEYPAMPPPKPAHKRQPIVEYTDSDLLESAADPSKNDLPRKYETVDDCVDQGIQTFAKDHPQRAYVLQLRMENLSIEEIAVRIGRDPIPTKSYLYECRGKLKPYVEECWEMLAA